MGSIEDIDLNDGILEERNMKRDMFIEKLLLEMIEG